jgi:hypothetical protein
VIRRSKCKSASLSEEDALFCKQMLMQSKHRSIQQRLNKMKKAGPTQPPAPSPAPQTGYLVNAQWDGRTFPDVEWALDITRQITSITYPFEPEEVQYQLLIPTRPGPANAPTFTAFNPLSRDYFLVTKKNDFTGHMFGITISGDTNSSNYTYPMTNFKFVDGNQAQMVGLETVLLGGQQVVLVFYDNGAVQIVDPVTGQGKPFSNCLAAGRQANAVTYRQGTHDIFVLSQSTNAQRPNYGMVIFNYQTKQSQEIIFQVPTLFDPTVEQGFEMVWMETLQNLLVFFTGNFDQIMYVQPYTGVSAWAIWNMHDYSGGYGAYEFTVSTYLEDLDTTANAAIDDVGKRIYFQCSEVDQDSGDITTSLCTHELPTAVAQWSWIDTAIAPMTYGYAAAEYVQIE